MKHVFLISLFAICSISSAFTQNATHPNDESIKKMHELAYGSWDDGKYDSAEYYYKETIQLQEAIHGHYSEKNASYYVNLGAVYKKLYHLKKSLETLNIAEEIYKKVSPNSIYLGYIYNNKANIYFTYSDYDEAELYYRNCLNHFIDNNYTSNSYFDIAYLNLFNVLVTSNRLTEAKDLINYIIDINLTEDGEYKRHLFLATAYDVLGETENALKHYKLAEKALYSFTTINSRDEIELSYRYASLLISKNQLDESLTLLSDNLQTFNSVNTVDYQKLTETYLLIGNIHYIKKDYLNCYNWLNDAIKKLQDKLNEANLDANYISSRILSSFFVDIKHLHAQACIAIYDGVTPLNGWISSYIGLWSNILE